ncbi:MAG: glycoside hydrolase family 2 protein [Bacteroidales bacterium]|nr:glycoside hydrolase family 2 protein [Bacteroidales bacterium]
MLRLTSLLYALVLSALVSFSFAAKKNETNTSIPDNTNKLTKELNSNWSFSESGKNDWKEAIVPGTIHSDLIRLNLLPDPFFGTNETKIQWVEDKDWAYKTVFTVDESQLSYKGANINFKGLDTYADVYLNGSNILSSKNMFIEYEIPVKDILRKGNNILVIKFHSPINSALEQWESNGWDYPADNDHHDKHTSIFTRKAPYHYGWDWGIRMAGVGIWRPISLTFFNQAKINDVFIRQKSISSEKAVLSNEIEFNSIKKENSKAIVNFIFSLNGKEVKKESKTIDVQAGKNHFVCQSTINNPELWMPLGWGKQTLYDVTTEIRDINGILIDSNTKKIGLRNIKVINQEDKDGKSFYFEVNGNPLFAKGANYIPSDIILTNFKKEDYKRMFDDIKAANLNMIRIWGGGIYEEEYFYELADEYGILIWQDFMFACTAYPADNAFLDLVAQEAEYNLKRLRNHACIAMWCGNNEIIEAIKYWGWDKKYSKEIHSSMFSSYDKLFRNLLPEKVKEFDPDKFYLHSSPDSANWGRPASLGWGDAHYWGVWYGVQPFEILDSRVPRFMSEFGFQSFPEMKVISTFSNPSDYALESEVMKAHQKSSTGNSIIKTYMEMYYKVPEKFEDFVYINLIMQGNGMRHGMEAHRRNKPFCMGSLYWQLNDNWPVVSWSSIDYFGNWKALHYQAKRAFEPVIVNAIEENGKINIYTISDELIDRGNLSLEIEMIDFTGKKIKKQTIKTNVKANISQLVYSLDSVSYATKEERKNSFVSLSLKDNKGKTINNTLFYFEKPKDLNLPKTDIHSSISVKDGVCQVEIYSKNLVKDLFIEIPFQGAHFSDNFFDLLPGEKKKITISSSEIKKGDKIDLKFTHLRDTY